VRQTNMNGFSLSICSLSRDCRHNILYHMFSADYHLHVCYVSVLSRHFYASARL